MLSHQTQQPLWQLTVEQFKEVILQSFIEAVQHQVPNRSEKQIAKSLTELSKILGINTTTLWRLKKAGVFEDAISYLGKRTFHIDVDYATQLMNKHFKSQDKMYKTKNKRHESN